MTLQKIQATRSQLLTLLSRPLSATGGTIVRVCCVKERGCRLFSEMLQTQGNGKCAQRNLSRGARTPQSISVGIARGYELESRGSIPDKDKRYFCIACVQTGLGAHPAFYISGVRDSFHAGLSGWSVKVTNHFHLMPRSVMEEQYSTPPCVFVEWCLIKHRDNFTSTFYITCDRPRNVPACNYGLLT